MNQSASSLPRNQNEDPVQVASNFDTIHNLRDKLARHTHNRAEHSAAF